MQLTHIWWDADEPGDDEIRNPGVGMWKFVEGGERYLPGDWPEEDTKAFDDDGAVAVYEELPEEERVGDYEPLPAAWVTSSGRSARRG